MTRRTFQFVKMLTALSLVTASVGCASLSDQAVELLNQPAPVSRVTMLDGEYKTLDEYAGKHVFLLFWATWCGHSRPAVEDFNELAQRYAGNPNYVFLAVSVDKAADLEILKERIHTQDLRYVRHVFSGNDAHDETFVSYYGTIIPYVIALDPRQTVKVVDKSVSALEDYIEDVRR